MVLSIIQFSMNKEHAVYGFSLTVALLAIGIALMGYSAFVYSFGTAVYHADVYVSIYDADGKPLQNVAVDGWGGQSKEYLHTDQDGKVFLQVGYLDGASIFGAPKWPKEMPIKLRFENQNKEHPSPHFQLLYYRFEIDPHSAKCAYNVFVSDYDYWFGETWVGTFYPPSAGKKPEFKKTVLEGYTPTTYTAVAPRKRDSYDDKSGELVHGAALSGVDAFETEVQAAVVGKRQLEIHLRLVHRGMYPIDNGPIEKSN